MREALRPVQAAPTRAGGLRGLFRGGARAQPKRRTTSDDASHSVAAHVIRVWLQVEAARRSSAWRTVPGASIQTKCPASGTTSTHAFGSRSAVACEARSTGIGPPPPAKSPTGIVIAASDDSSRGSSFTLDSYPLA